MSEISLSLDFSADTTHNVTSDHFSGNIISTKNTVSGVPTPDYQDAVEYLDINTLRYPAGQPDIVYSDGMLHGNDLHSHLVSFLDWAKEEDFKVLLVTPTFDSYPGPEVISEFVRLVLEQYGDIVTGFEIGNEYWQQQGEAEYGTVASETILAIENAVVEFDYDPQILVQMGNPAGAFTNFPSGVDTWSNRIASANGEIIDNISSPAQDLIDAVVEHYYYNDSYNNFTGASYEVNFIPNKFQVWEERFGRPLDLHITEWNITNRNTDALGVRAGPILVQQFENMIEMGVDKAYVWPPHHNTANDLAGSRQVLIDTETSLVINSVGGAIFDLMSTSLPGTHIVDMSFEGMNELINLNTYASEEITVLYVSSLAEGLLDVSIDLNGYIDSFVSLNGVLVGYDTNSSNGEHFSYVAEEFVNSDFVTIEGENHYLNEHDVNAKVTFFDESDLGGGSSLSFQLKPHEVMQITYYHVETDVGSFSPPPPDADGLNIVSGGENDTLTGGDGNDTIDAGGGDDLITGGLGDDDIVGNRGNDTIQGNEGGDRINGWGGEDEIHGGFGADKLFGQQGSDLIFGDSGDDRIVGGEGDDTLHGGDGRDTINGADGDDFIFGGESDVDLRDIVFGGSGNDSIDSGFGNDLVYGQDDNDTIFGGFGSDELHGQEGNDVITGGAFSDLIYGGAGDDFVNGGFGHDRINGGIGADKFFHVGVEGHGSDWVQDYSAAEGDVLVFGDSSASGDDFLVSFSHREADESAHSLDPNMAEAFVIYNPTGQILWALIDGASQDEINLKIGGDVFDLLA